MAGYRDQRPTRSGDSLKLLVDRAKNKQTVPYGNKVARANEGTTFHAADGQRYRWDGDTIADYDQRITEGRNAIEETKVILEEAEGNISAAQDRISSVENSTTPTAIGDTAASQINSRRLIVGRDAILTGTVDINQLNVTGEMSASIVNMMDANARRLVVSEDAILNRATVVESIVTPELIANKINVKQLGAQLITTGSLQTSTLSNTGVKIDGTGYKAYNEAGELAVDLNGKDNLVIGKFSTSTKESSGVTISQGSVSAAIDLYTPNWGGNSTYQYSHAGIWFSVPSDLRARGLNIIATDKKDTVNTDPGMLLRPGLQSYGFQGMVANNAPGTKSGKYTHTAGIPAGGYSDYTFSFINQMVLPTGGQIMVVPSIVNQNKNETAYTVYEDNDSGFKLRVVNLVAGRATGTVWIKWVAFIV